MNTVSHEDLKFYAALNSQEIVLTKTISGNCEEVEVTRKTTPREKSIIGNSILAALWAIKGCADERSAARTAENIVKLLIKDVNSYETVFRPIMNFMPSR